MSLLTFRFRQSRSQDLDWCIELAKRGTFAQRPVGKLTVYESSFNLLDPLQVGHALSLAVALAQDKKAEVFSSGTMVTMANVREVLHCYQQSIQVDDPHAHCQFRIRLQFDLTVTPFTIDLDGKSKEFLFPCRLAAAHSYGIHYEHPGAIDRQLESALWRAGTRWCPRLAARSTVTLVHVERQRR